ncbi:putative transmembrane protein precursor [Popillia japonica]|uniref:Transmembrane protein n=1 Tax=Popillia japonica TaxID=7064 RepID=A0AAW1KHX8_POPJA
MSTEIFITLLYLLVSVCLIYPPAEFVSAGITIPNIFSPFLGSQYEQFVKYHIKRSCITLLIYSCIPLGYIIWFLLFTNNKDIYVLIFNNSNLIWKIYLTTAIALPILALYEIYNWYRNNYEQHPIAKNINKYANNNSSWSNVASDINAEYRRIDKVCIETSSITQIVVTENWIIKVTPLTMSLIYQGDAVLIVQNCDRHTISRTQDGEVQYMNIVVQSTRRNIDSRTQDGEVQYMNIVVQSTRRNIDSFVIRLNSDDFQDLQDRVSRSIEIPSNDRVSRSIEIPSNVNFHKNIIEKFVDTFKEFVQLNPKYRSEQQIDQCIGCMQNTNYVKLQKLCVDNENDANKCSGCYCRPMWCVDCMAKWFASRQNNNETNVWLSSKCTCPMCRATFCLLDVCMLEAEGT